MNLVRVVCRAALAAYVSTETGGDGYDSQASNMDSISCQSQWTAVSGGDDGEGSVELVFLQRDEVWIKKVLIIAFSPLDYIFSYWKNCTLFHGWTATRTFWYRINKAVKHKMSLSISRLTLTKYPDFLKNCEPHFRHQKPQNQSYRFTSCVVTVVVGSCVIMWAVTRSSSVTSLYVFSANRKGAHSMCIT